MATDIEESDTDDHERPAPPKRQCTRLKATETIWDMVITKYSYKLFKFQFYILFFKKKKY